MIRCQEVARCRRRRLCTCVCAPSTPSPPPPQAYLAFGDAGYLDMFKEVYAAAMTNLQLDPQWNGHVWCVAQ